MISCYGSAGTDELYGKEKTDFLSGGIGSDSLDGGGDGDVWTGRRIIHELREYNLIAIPPTRNERKEKIGESPR